MTTRVLSADEGECSVHATHSPEPKVLHEHHVLPVSWGGEHGLKVIVCPTGHYNIHHLIDAYVKVSGIPGWLIRQHYAAAERALAASAWDQRPSDHPPYTVNFEDLVMI